MRSPPVIFFLILIRESLQVSLQGQKVLPNQRSAVFKFAIFEEQYCGDVAHAVFACDFVVVINVKFADNCLVCILLCKLLNNRRSLMQSTPCCPKVNNYSLAGLDSLTSGLVSKFQCHIFY